jgi:hypothetical protein
VLALTVQPGDRGETASMPMTQSEAGGAVTELARQAAEADAVGAVETLSEVGVEQTGGGPWLARQAGVAGSGRDDRG